MTVNLEKWCDVELNIRIIEMVTLAQCRNRDRSSVFRLRDKRRERVQLGRIKAKRILVEYVQRKACQMYEDQLCSRWN